MTEGQYGRRALGHPGNALSVGGMRVGGCPALWGSPHPPPHRTVLPGGCHGKKLPQGLETHYLFGLEPHGL